MYHDPRLKERGPHFLEDEIGGCFGEDVRYLISCEYQWSVLNGVLGTNTHVECGYDPVVVVGRDVQFRQDVLRCPAVHYACVGDLVPMLVVYLWHLGTMGVYIGNVHVLDDEHQRKER